MHIKRFRMVMWFWGKQFKITCNPSKCIFLRFRIFCIFFSFKKKIISFITPSLYSGPTTKKHIFKKNLLDPITFKNDQLLLRMTCLHFKKKQVILKSNRVILINNRVTLKATGNLHHFFENSSPFRILKFNYQLVS